MSLAVWLPLNGDLHNQGLRQNLNIIGTDITFSNNGKIGKCADFNGTSSRIYIPNFSIDNQWSYGCWVNTPTSDTRRWELVIILNNSGSDADSQFAFWIHQKENRIESLANTKYNSVIPYTPYYNSWHHFFATYNGTILTSYIDGAIVKTQTITDGKYTGTNLTIGARCTAVNGSSFSYFFQGSLNDVRIYDHCLSQKEVKEIAKGLVLHYKLDFPRNLLISNGDYSGWNIGSGWLINGNVASFSRTGATSNNWVRLIPPLQINPNNYPNGITVSLDLKTPDVSAINQKRIGALQIYKEDGTRIGWVEPQWDLSSVQNNIWTRISYTFSQSALSTIYGSSSTADISYTMFSFQLVQNGDISIRNIQIEEGNKATPFSLNNNSNIIYDSSGYNNNGTIVGSLETTTSSQRYSYSTKFANGQYIRVNNRPADCMPKDAITVNLWQYAISWSNPISCTEGGGWNFENSSGIRFPIYILGVGYKIAQSSITPASTQNAWHMLTGTMDKDNVKIYYDGEEVGTVANGSTNGIKYANNYLFIGAEAQGDNTSPANSSYAGNLSDIRIYATALTPEQIKELYDTSMTIDNHGNIYARELVE